MAAIKSIYTCATEMFLPSNAKDDKWPCQAGIPQQFVIFTGGVW
jgi:hypothetical protein